MAWNIFSAPELDAPELAAPAAPLELPLVALSPAAWAENATLTAAATAAAMKVLLALI
jgi:hypothetical protein